MSYFDDLERDLHEEVDTAKKLLLSPLPDMKIEMSLEEIEKELLELSALHHICARARSRGKSPDQIARDIRKEYGYVVSATQVANMVAKVLNLAYRMTPRSVELMRQQVEIQLDSIIKDMYDNAAEEQRTYLKPNEAKLVMEALDRRIKLQGLDKPTEIKISVADEIKAAQQQLHKRLEGIIEHNDPEALQISPILSKEEQYV